MLARVSSPCTAEGLGRRLRHTITDDLVAGLALDVASEADTAGIFLEARVVQTPKKNVSQCVYIGMARSQR